jgi:hypothetical protein
MGAGWREEEGRRPETSFEKTHTHNVDSTFIHPQPIIINISFYTKSKARYVRICCGCLLVVFLRREMGSREGASEKG